MKMLLTSAGIVNQEIASSLGDLAAKSLAQCKVGFIPTAANAQPGNKDWFFGQIDNLRKFGVSWIDIVDIAAPDIDWRKRLEAVDIVFVGGGNTFYLLDQVRKSGFSDWLSDSLGEKVYVGVSAGSIIACPTIDVALIEPADDNFLHLQDLEGMNVFSSWIQPHCSDQRFDVMREWATANKRTVYALDDTSAIAVDGGVASIVTKNRAEFYDYSKK